MDLKDLKKEIPFQWRVQSTNQFWASCVAYIDARDVQDLLDDVVGPENWQCKYEEHKGNLFCSIGIRTIDIFGRAEEGDEINCWTWKSDCGTESNVEKQKGEASDAFKRAAVMWGIGRFLYSKEIVKLPVKEKGKDQRGNPKYVPFSDKTGKFVYDKDVITQWCNALSK